MSIDHVKKTNKIYGSQPFESLIGRDVGNDGTRPVVDFYGLAVGSGLKTLENGKKGNPAEFSLPSLSNFIDRLARK